MMPTLMLVVGTVCACVEWLDGGQNIGPTIKVVSSKFIYFPHVLPGGALSSPFNPTSIEGAPIGH